MKLLIALGICAVAAAQQYEIGGAGGTGFLNHANVTNAVGSGTAGFTNGGSFGGFLGHTMYPRLSGELHYTYRMSDLRVSSAGQTATFKGMAHAVHYDLLFYPTKRRMAAQPFVAVGGGMKIFRGTGQEAAYQPLSSFALLTRTFQVQPLATVGGGVKYRIGKRAYLRTEFRDYITPFPKKVVAPAPGAKIGTLLHDIVPLVGLSIEF